MPNEPYDCVGKFLNYYHQSTIQYQKRHLELWFINSASVPLNRKDPVVYYRMPICILLGKCRMWFCKDTWAAHSPDEDTRPECPKFGQER